jgi:hypothetical protein
VSAKDTNAILVREGRTAMQMDHGSHVWIVSSEWYELPVDAIESATHA